MKTKRGIFSIALLLALIASMLMPAAVMATPELNTDFYGTLTIVVGSNSYEAPEGTLVEGKVLSGSKEIGYGDKTVEDEGIYATNSYGDKLEVAKTNDSYTLNGKEVHFYVTLGGETVEATYDDDADVTFDSSVSAHEVDLTATFDSIEDLEGSYSPTGEDVATNADIYVLFNRSVSEVGSGLDSITVYDNTDSAAVDITAEISSSNSAKINIIPDADLDAGCWYTVTVPAGSFQDAFQMTNDEITWTFKTSSGGADNEDPYIVEPTVPEDGATGVWINDSEDEGLISASFSEAIYDTTGSGVGAGDEVSGIEIYKSSDTGDDSAGTVTGIINADGITIDISHTGNLEWDTEYSVLIPQNCVQDAAGNKFYNSGSDYTWSFTTAVQSDTTGPTLSDLYPAAGATVAIGTEIQATASEEIGFDEAYITMYKTSDKTSTVEVTPSCTSTSSGYIFSLSHANLSYSTGYTVEVLAGALYDASYNYSAADYTWTFTTQAKSSSSSSGGGGGGGSSDNFSISFFSKTASYELDNGEVQSKISITGKDKVMTLVLPADTVCQNVSGNDLTSLTGAYNTAPPAEPAWGKIIGEAFNFTPTGATFEPSISLTYNYEDADIPTGFTEDDLALVYYDSSSSTWKVIGGTVDASANTLTTDITHFTTFAVMAVEPAAFSVSGLTVSSASIDVGGSVTVTVDVSNDGGREGTYTAVLKINGTQEDSQDVTLAGGETESVDFNVSGKSAGTYTVDVDGQSGSFTVKAPATTSVAPTTTAAPSVTTSAPATTSAAPKTSTAPAATTQAPEPTKSTNWGLIIGIIIAVIVIAVLVSMILMKRKKA